MGMRLTSMKPRFANCKPLDGFQYLLRFHDGKEGIIVLINVPLLPKFTPLKELVLSQYDMGCTRTQNNNLAK